MTTESWQEKEDRTDALITKMDEFLLRMQDISDRLIAKLDCADRLVVKLDEREESGDTDKPGQ